MKQHVASSAHWFVSDVLPVSTSRAASDGHADMVKSLSANTRRDACESRSSHSGSDKHAASTSAQPVTHLGSSVHWSYEDETGPVHWATLSPGCAAAAGKKQSPVDLVTSIMIEAYLPHITFTYHEPPLVIVNNGHTIQVNCDGGSAIALDGVTFALKQFHFHSPWEHTIDSVQSPIEEHFVHADPNGNLAVIGVMMNVGEASEILDTVWAEMPESAGCTNIMRGAAIDPGAFLPERKDYFRYNGSLTTPPCTAGVRWLVMKDPIQISDVQLKQFHNALAHANNRPVQAGIARPILK